MGPCDEILASETGGSESTRPHFSAAARLMQREPRIQIFVQHVRWQLLQIRRTVASGTNQQSSLRDRNPMQAFSVKGCAKDAAASEAIEFELMRSGYPLQNVEVACAESMLVLSGFVSRYFHLQVAIETARRRSFGRRIVSEISVRASDPNSSDFDDN